MRLLAPGWSGRAAPAAMAACAALLLCGGTSAAAEEPGAETATATARVSTAVGLTEGQKITVTGQGFRPGLPSVAVGLCRKGYAGIKDCDLGGGATLVNIDGSGRLPTITLTVRARFAGVDCRTAACVVGISPLPSAAPAALRTSNTVDIPVGFRGGTVPGEPSGTGSAVTAPGPTRAPDARWGGPSTALWAASTGVTVLCAASALFLPFPRRDRSATPHHPGGTR
ncbi:neocarzinostatin apoprotein domain-containing protein [Streptomyces flavidovirens]|uniref:neocarzinostatin apoprotein domain-containing protein n=1 Tax=Streptomyces flavidovirens TaxID=67298 RepID=UPI00042420E1|nr:neocarzinostatin apoprotein domain-containing protein [Streptomyces flavidovirens]